MFTQEITVKGPSSVKPVLDDLYWTENALVRCDTSFLNSKTKLFKFHEDASCKLPPEVRAQQPRLEVLFQRNYAPLQKLVQQHGLELVNGTKKPVTPKQYKTRGEFDFMTVNRYDVDIGFLCRDSLDSFSEKYNGNGFWCCGLTYGDTLNADSEHCWEPWIRVDWFRIWHSIENRSTYAKLRFAKFGVCRKTDPVLFEMKLFFAETNPRATYANWLRFGRRGPGARPGLVAITL